MSFVSFEFLILIALLFLFYYPVGRFFPKHQWVLLLIASYIFYAFASLKFIPFLLFASISSWAIAILTEKINSKYSEKVEKLNKNSELYREEKKKVQRECDRRKKIVLGICIAINIFILVVLKYSEFLLGVFKADSFSLSQIIFPIGISFYTFQSIGYCIDVYRGIVTAEKSFFRYALYVSYFPHISQGPIGQYKDLAPQFIKPHKFSYVSFTSGLERILLGLLKKLFIADNIAMFVNYYYSEPDTHLAIVMVIATFLYGIQLYADFSGYMDIAIGVSQCLGIKLAENFKTPYFSSSIAEFWRRWHISLGDWFRDYLYYPLLRTKWFFNISKFFNAKKKKGLARIMPTVLSLFITWLLIGLWHGSSWNFIAYGLYHGGFIILATILGGFYSKTKKILHINEDNLLWKFFKIIRTFTIVTIGYVLFRSSSLSEAIGIYKNILTNLTISGLVEDIKSSGLAVSYYGTVMVAVIMFLIIELLEQKKTFVERINSSKLAIRWACLFIMLYIVMMYALTAPADSNNFLYFNF